MTTSSSKTLYLGCFVAACIAVIAGVLASPQPTVDWDGDIVLRAHNLMGLPTETSSLVRTPLEGLVVVVTGATSGIGMGVTQRLVVMGAEVIAIGRSPSKLEKLKTEFPSISTVIADFVDLESVARAADEINEQYNRVDVLINNAGIHANADPSYRTDPASKQGYDKVFGVNYLAHFLLTEKLMPLLQNSDHSKIIQVSSTFHIGSDGSDLAVSKDAPKFVMSPIASRPGGSHGFFVFRNQRSYANSKLAQILHAHAINRRWSDINAVSICPTWVGTNFVGEPRVWIVGQIAYDSTDYGIASVFEALLDGKKQDKTSGKFYVNTQQFQMGNEVLNSLSPWTYSVVPIRDAIVLALAGILILFQRLMPRVFEADSSVQSYDPVLQDELYEWSKAAVSKWL